MNSLIKTTIKRPVTVCVLVVILLAVGVLSAMDMSTNLLPNIKMPMLGVTAIYPGAAASSVQTDVTDKLENVFKTIPGITELDSRSYDNVSVCILTFDYGTDIDAKIDDIEDALKTVTLPQACNEPTFTKVDMNGTAAATISLYNDKDDIELLAREAEELSAKLSAIEGVGSVSLMGKPEKQIQITALQGLDITALAIVQALSQENLNLPLGTILQNGAVVSVRNASDATSMLQIMRLPVKMDLGESVLGSLASVKTAVGAYATCTLDEFNDYVEKALDAKRVIDEIEGKTADELEERYDSLASLKSLMTLLRENSSQSLRLMWHTIDTSLVQNEEFVNMSEDDLRALAENGNLNLSYDVLKWLQDGAKEGTLKTDWFKLVTFRECMEHAELTENIPYEHFAYLFQNGGSVTYTVIEDTEGNPEHTETVYYDGLDLLHSDVDHADCDTSGENACTREVFTHGQAVDACEFADSVNAVAYRQIIDTVREAEQNPENANDPVISDELFAALFVNSTQGDDFAALMSPQVIHIIRLPNFNTKADGRESIIDVLTEVKQAHVDDNGNAKYINGNIVERDEENNIIVTIGEKQFKINSFGRLVDDEGNLVDGQGNVISLTDKDIEKNFYSYGLYRVFDDEELIGLYNRLGLDGDAFGITPTLDTVRFIRITDFTENASSLIVPVAYVGKVQTLTTYDAYSQYNGRLAVALEVYAVSDANTTAVVTAVKKAIADVKGAGGVSGEIVLLDDKAEFINDSIMNVLTSIIIGGVLAVLVIYLFVGKIGSSLVVSITMPLSVLVALLGLWAMGISLNMVSLGGLAVGIGMLVDNSIVVLESITKRRDRGENVFDSCLNGTREVAGSLLASTLTNICVFFPILFAKGLTREIFYDLVWAVLFSIVMSLIVAVTVIPSLYHLIYNRSPRPRYKKDKDGNKVFVGTFEQNEPRGKAEPLYDENAAVAVKETTDVPEPTVAETAVTDGENDGKGKRKKNGKNKKSVDRATRKRSVLTRMENGYGALLSKVLNRRVLVCVVALAVFGASVGLVFTTGVDFLPSVDKGVIEVNLRFNGAATLDEARDATKQATDAIREEYGEDIQFASYTVGKQGMLPMTITGVVRVQTYVDKLDTTETVNDIRKLLQEKQINAANITVSEIDGVVAELTGEMAGQSVTLMSDDMSKLAAAAKAVAAKLNSMTADGIASVTDNTPATNDEISFTFDKDECAKRGVDYQNAVLLLRVGMSGYAAATINVDGDSQNVNVIFDDYTKDTVEHLLNVVVGFDSDGAVKIADVLQKNPDGSLYSMNQVVTNINKIDGKFVTSVDVESYNVDMGTVSSRIEKAVKEVLADHPDVVYQEGGVAHYLTDAMNGLVISLIAAFLLLYGVMACQFESLVKPFIVIMSIPFSFTGGFLALVITGTSLNVVSFVGIIMLMGVIVNGAIVMIDKIDQLIKEGVDPKQAVVEGCKSRLRPILMTTLTTILALIPLALGLGRGGEFMQPMGIVVIGGLLLGTLVTLVLIPCFYCLIKRIKFTSPKKDDATADGESDDNGEGNEDNGKSDDVNPAELA